MAGGRWRSGMGAHGGIAKARYISIMAAASRRSLGNGVSAISLQRIAGAIGGSGRLAAAHVAAAASSSASGWYGGSGWRLMKIG